MVHCKKELILIVDDDTKNLQFTAKLLQEKGYESALALNGETAIEFVKKEKPCLILMDVMMPRINGYEVCKLLKENEDTKDIPVIVLTAKNDNEEISKAFESGAVDFINKPFNQTELFARIDTHIKLSCATIQIKTQQEQLINEAYNRGIIEVISGIIHNFGNALSTLHLEMEELRDYFLSEEEKTIKFTEEILMPELNLVENQTEKLKKITRTLPEILRLMKNTKKEEKKILNFLESKIDYMSEVVQFHQNFEKGIGTKNYYDLKVILDFILDLYKEPIEKRGIKIKRDYGKISDVLCEKGSLIQILSSIIKNSYEELGQVQHDEKIIQVKLSQTEKNIIISITDNGRGISDEVLENVFDFGFSTKGNGSKGLGLYTCKEILKRNNNSINIETEVNKGTTINIMISAN